MTMSASAAMVVMSTTFMVAATASTVATSASALSAKEVHEVLYLLVASLSLFEHSSLEVQRLSSQRMVEAHGSHEHTRSHFVAV